MVLLNKQYQKLRMLSPLYLLVQNSFRLVMVKRESLIRVRNKRDSKHPLPRDLSINTTKPVLTVLCKHVHWNIMVVCTLNPILRLRCPARLNEHCIFWREWECLDEKEFEFQHFSK